MTESVATATAPAVDLSTINFSVEPNFATGDDSPYEEKARLECEEKAKQLLGTKADAQSAQKKNSAAFRALVTNLAIMKAIKVGNGGRKGEWGAFLEYLTKKTTLGLKRRTVDRWIVKAAFGDHALNLPRWVVRKLEGLKHQVAIEDADKKSTVEKIEFTPPSLQERNEMLDMIRQLTRHVGTENVWQTVYDAVKDALDAAESEKQQAEARLASAPIPNGPEESFYPASIDDDHEAV